EDFFKLPYLLINRYKTVMIKIFNTHIVSLRMVLPGICLMVLWIASCGKDVKEEKGRALPQPQGFTIEAESRSAVFSWEAVDRADGYFLEIGTSATFSEVIARTDTTQQTRVAFEGLSPETTYYARLRAIDKNNPSFTSNILVESFATAE